MQSSVTSGSEPSDVELSDMRGPWGRRYSEPAWWALKRPDMLMIIKFLMRRGGPTGLHYVGPSSNGSGDPGDGGPTSGNGGPSSSGSGDRGDGGPTGGNVGPSSNGSGDPGDGGDGGDASDAPLPFDTHPGPDADALPELQFGEAVPVPTFDTMSKHELAAALLRTSWETSDALNNGMLMKIPKRRRQFVHLAELNLAERRLP